MFKIWKAPEIDPQTDEELFWQKINVLILIKNNV